MLTIRSLWQLGSGVDKFEFAAYLLNATVESSTWTLNELKSNNAFYEHLEKCLGASVSNEVGEILYIVVRLLKPDIVVETGVERGITSCFILQAEEDNKQGELYSIDLPPTGRRLTDYLVYRLPEGKQSGWIIPANLRHRWHLILGDAKEKLPFLLKQLGKIDIFLHDSLHTVEHQKWEYETAWPYIKEGGILLSDDAYAAFMAFCNEHKAYPLHCKYFGGINKGGGG